MPPDELPQVSATDRTEVVGLEDLRLRVLHRATGIAAVAAPSIALVSLLSAWWTHTLTPFGVAISSFALAFPLAWSLAPLFGYRTNGGILIATILVTALLVELRGSIGAAPLVLQLLALVLSGVLFGRGGVAASLAGLLATLAVSGAAVVGGYVPPVNLALWDPSSPSVWIRASLILSLFGGGTALIVTHVLAQLDEDARQLRAALMRERDQRLARERAESERSATLAALVESQQVEAIGRMAGGIAHDYNNALTVIMAAAETIRTDSDLGHESRTCLDDITSTAFEAAGLTRSLLSLGRRDAVEPDHVEVEPLLRRLASRLRRILPHRIRLNLGRVDPTRVFVDANQLERVLTNLILNARDAIGTRGEIRVTSERLQIEAGARGLEGGAYVAIRVSDTGHGMTDEVQQRLFEPFFSTKPEDRGSGIGMTLVQNFIAETHGRVEVESSPGHGSTVSLLLPEAPGEQPRGREVEPEPPSHETGASPPMEG